MNRKLRKHGNRRNMTTAVNQKINLFKFFPSNYNLKMNNKHFKPNNKTSKKFMIIEEDYGLEPKKKNKIYSK